MYSFPLPIRPIETKSAGRTATTGGDRRAEFGIYTMESTGKKLADVARVVVVTDDAALGRDIDHADVRFMAHQDAGDLIELTKRLMPRVLVVDLTGPNQVRDFERAARILTRCAATQTVQLVAVVPVGFTEAWQNKIKAAGAFDLVLHPPRPGHLARAIERGDARALELLNARQANAGRKECPTKPVDGNRSLLVRTIKCLQHDEPQPLARYILRVGTVVTDIDFFDLPVYKTPTRNADYVNYHLLNVMVCPRCLMASNDARYFNDPTDKAEVHPYNAVTRQQLRDSLGQRQAVALDLGDTFHTHERTVDEAIVAYELALQTSRVLYDCNRFSLQVELARMGNYHLRLAVIKTFRPQGIAPAELIAHYRAALDLLGEAFVVVEGPLLFKVAYQVVALSIALGEDTSAYRYITRLTTMAREAVLQKEERAALDRYFLRCQQAWEDRDLYRVQPVVEVA